MLCNIILFNIYIMNKSAGIIFEFEGRCISLFDYKILDLVMNGASSEHKTFQVPYDNATYIIFRGRSSDQYRTG